LFEQDFNRKRYSRSQRVRKDGNIFLNRNQTDLNLFVFFFLRFCKQIISELLQNKLDISLLVITKAMSKTEYKGKQAHVELNEKLKKRNAGEGYHVGDRVAYVILAGAQGTAAYERAEDPIYALENNSQLDAHYYMDMLKRPLVRIFKPVIRDAERELST